MDILHKRLADKKSELQQLRETFFIEAERNNTDDTYERNAISDLVVMLQLKAEIKELEFAISCMSQLK